jgi:hypothetical protein
MPFGVAGEWFHLDTLPITPHIITIHHTLAHNNLSMHHTSYITEIFIISDPMPFEAAGERFHPDSHLCMGAPLDDNCVPTNDGQNVIIL